MNKNNDPRNTRIEMIPKKYTNINQTRLKYNIKIMRFSRSSCTVLTLTQNTKMF